MFSVFEAGGSKVLSFWRIIYMNYLLNDCILNTDSTAQGDERSVGVNPCLQSYPPQQWHYSSTLHIQQVSHKPVSHPPSSDTIVQYTFKRWVIDQYPAHPPPPPPPARPQGGPPGGGGGGGRGGERPPG